MGQCRPCHGSAIERAPREVLSRDVGPHRKSAAAVPGARVVRAIASVQDHLVAVSLARLRALGFDDVTPALLEVIVAVAPEGSKLVDLRRGGSRSKQAISKLVDELRRRGYADLVSSPDDGRSKIVVPTKGGVALQATGVEVLGSLADEVARALGDGSEALADALERLATVLADLA